MLYWLVFGRKVVIGLAVALVGCWDNPNGLDELGIAVYWGMRNPVGCVVICGAPNGCEDDI